MNAEEFLAVVLINGLWQAPLIAFAAWLVLRALLHTTASQRYAVWFGALLACVAFPIATASLAGAISLPPGAIFIMEALWATFSLALLLRIVASIVALQRTKQTALPVAPRDRDALAHWNGRPRSLRDLRLCTSNDIESPAAVGLFDAMVLLPEWMLREKPRDLDGIVIHELAHLRRYDDWTSLAGSIVAALLFFNPAVRWIGTQLELEREIACDDIAVAGVGDAVAYAACLTGIARDVSGARRFSLTPGFFAARKTLSLRVERLLERRTPRTSTLAQVMALASATMAAVLWASCVLVPLASAAMAAPQDDPAVHRQALEIYASLRECRNDDPRLIEAERKLALLGTLSELHLTSRAHAPAETIFRYRGRTANGDVSIQVRIGRRGDVLGYTVQAAGTGEHRKPIAAFAYYSTLPDPDWQ